MSEAAIREAIREAIPGLSHDFRVRIGHIVSVSGSNAVAVLERAAEAGDRDKDPRIQVGGVVRIETPGAAVVGLISAISAPMPELAGKSYDIGLIEINLTGEIDTDDEGELLFRRGVTRLPSLGDAVRLTDRDDLNCVFAPVSKKSVKIGALYQDSAVPARLMIDDLLRKHFIVVGSTGSGKSCALTCVLQRLLEARKTAHIVILDVHNEYATAFGDLVERITLKDFRLPLWMLNFQELCVALTSGETQRDDEIELLNEGVLFAKRRYAEAAASPNSLLARRLSETMIITADTPAPFRVSDVIAFIDNELGRLERTRLIAPHRRLKAKLEMLAVDQRYQFMFGSLTVEDTMTDVLSRLFRIPNGGRPISVIDLSTVPHEILDVVVSVISRLAFDLAVWSEGGLPMLIVCEEAHRYVPVGGDDKYVPTRLALGRIAKEGRKYGISLGLVSQRPSELDPTILSQCSTAIVLRLTSEKDQQVIRGSTYEGLVDLIDFLPLLADREALILGQGAAMPMRVRIDELGAGELPHTKNPVAAHGKERPSMDRTELDAIVSRWRTAGRDRSDVWTQ
jgi:DNA helicase HerA-like ATPase